MAKQKASVQSTAIEQTAKLYLKHAGKASAEKKESEAYKIILQGYASSNPQLFDGKELKFECGVRIEKRVSEKASHDAVIGVNWLKEAIGLGLGDAISISIDSKKLPDTINAKQIKCLDKISFEVEEVETLAVCLK